MSVIAAIAKRALTTVVLPAVKNAVMDAVKNVALDVGKKVMDTVGKEIKDKATDLIKGGGKVLGDLIKNPVGLLKDIGKALLPKPFQDALKMGQSIMQAASNIIGKLLEKMGINININISVNTGGTQGAGDAATKPITCGTDSLAAGGAQASNGAGGAQPTTQANNTGDTQATTQANNTGGAQGATQANNAGGTQGATQAGGTQGSGDAKDPSGVMNMSGKQLAELQRTNPQKFMDAFSNMSAEQRTLTMNKMQDYMQQMNQLTSMMTNMMQIRHDTAKSVINNLRV